MAGMAIPAFAQANKSTAVPKSTLLPKSAPQPRPEKVRDPVCGLMVEKDQELSAVYKGKTYYFCSKADRDKFKKNSEKYVKAK
jgi:YHS domain-containing protein